MNLVIKDAVRQIIGRVASAIGGFIVIKLITPYLGPLRFGDYSTILKYFAIWSAFADFGIYVIALKHLGKIKDNDTSASEELQTTYGKFVSTRALMIFVVYTLALVVAYLIPAYTSNPYLVRGLPLGMLFSASFMRAGILQIPLQLFWKMEQLSIGLILARIVQLAILLLTIFVVYVTPSPDNFPISPFLLVLSSVILSGVVQGAYVRWTGRNYLPLKRQRDWSFSKRIIGSNRKYGIAYYLSSFHTLIVLILLSIFYPTSQGYTYAGTWALALALIEILLIVPSALGNSLIHKVAAESVAKKQQRFGGLMHIVVWIGCLVIVGFTWFAPHVINFLGGSDYLTTTEQIGSDFILPFLGVVITLSFVKQVFNYIFVSTDLQNKLLQINLMGVIIGVGVGLPLVMHYDIWGGIAMQLLLEVVFVLGAVRVAWKHKVLPHIERSSLGVILLVTAGLAGLNLLAYMPLTDLTGRWWLGEGLLLTVLITGISYRYLKRQARKL